jgi:acetyltransferase-like isoleucine patch superfamily enzyme
MARSIRFSRGLVVTGELPPFSVVVGDPACMIRRYVDGEDWKRV